MRKQYYFQPSKNGLYAWNVDRLVEKTKDLQPFSINLEDIKEIDEVFWYDKGSRPTGRSLAEHFRLVNKSDLKYPIILSATGKIMDGRHRVIKALALGFNDIKVVQFEKDPEPDYEDISPEDLPYECEESQTSKYNKI